MAGGTILAAGADLEEGIRGHLEPRYELHLPGSDFVTKPGEHGNSLDLAAFNSWCAENLGFNPDVTTHIVMMGCAAVFLFLFFIPIARAYVEVPRGMRNLFEPVLLFIRDEMVYPWLGKKDGRILLPYFWTIFFFILFCNLIGLLPYPFGVTATGNFNITGALAVLTLLVGMIGGCIKKGGPQHGHHDEHHEVEEHAAPEPANVPFFLKPFVILGRLVKGLVPYFKSLVPGGVPGFLWPLVFVIEVAGLLTKHFALMVRLFANMTAGHAILAVLALWTSLAPEQLPIRMFQLFGATAMTLFEIFIGFVQAYIFTILSAIYISLSLAEEH